METPWLMQRLQDNQAGEPSIEAVEALNCYVITPRCGAEFELQAANATAAMAAARKRLGDGVTYSIVRRDATPRPLFGAVAPDGSIRL